MVAVTCACPQVRHRCGTLTSYNNCGRGCRCARCREANRVYKAARRKAEALGWTVPRLVPALGSQRRLDALALLGWSIRAISDERPELLFSALRKVYTAQRVTAETAAKIDRAYRDLCMRRAPAGQSASRAINEALRRGAVPGLAWDDIDDPAERPKGIDWQHFGRRAA